TMNSNTETLSPEARSIIEQQDPALLREIEAGRDAPTGGPKDAPKDEEDLDRRMPRGPLTKAARETLAAQDPALLSEVEGGDKLGAANADNGLSPEAARIVHLQRYSCEPPTPPAPSA